MKNSIFTFLIIFISSFILVSCNNTNKKEESNSKNNVNSTPIVVEDEKITDSSHTLASSEMQNDLCKFEWTLTSTSYIENVETALKDNLPKIKFNVNGTFNATICNNINGKYDTNDTSSIIKLYNVAQTRKMCNPEIMKIENNFKAADYEYDITKGYLTLSIGDNYFTFKRKSTSGENPMAN